LYRRVIKTRWGPRPWPWDFIPNMSNRISKHLIAIAFISGFCGLGSESLYFKILDFSVGSAPLVAFTIVASFIIGMGIGSIFSTKITRPWIIEALLAVYHICWAIFLPDILLINAKLIVSLAPLLGVNFASAIIGFMYIIIPAILLGVTFPVVVEQTRQSARSYFIYSLGAFCGIGLVDFLFYPAIGMPGTLIFLSWCHLITAVLLVPHTATLRVLKWQKFFWSLVYIGILTGCVQGIWLYYSELLFGAYYYIQPVVVALFLLGMTGGTLVWIFRPISFERNISFCFFGIFISSLLGAGWLLLPRVTVPLNVITQLAIMILPVTIPIGMIFPSFVSNLKQDRAQSGSVLLSLSFGNAMGLILTGAVLLRYCLPLMAFSIIAILFSYYIIFTRKTIKVYLWLTIILFTCSFIFSEQYYVQRFHNDYKKIEMIKTIRGPAEMTTVYNLQRKPYGRYHSGIKVYQKYPMERRFNQSGVSGLNLDYSRESMITAVGAAYSHENMRALVLGAGSGRSAGVAALIFNKVDVVDIGSTVKELMSYLYKDNYNLLKRPNVRYVQMDAILAPYIFNKGYDMVVLTVTSAFMHQSAKLYLIENMLALKKLLKPNGIFVYWMDSKTSPNGRQVLLNTSDELYKYRKILYVDKPTHESVIPAYILVVHSDEPLDYHPQKWNLSKKLIGDRPTKELFDSGEIKYLYNKPFSTIKNIHSLYKPSLDVLIYRGKKAVKEEIDQVFIKK